MHTLGRQSSLADAARAAGGARAPAGLGCVQREQDDLRPWPSLLGGVPGNPEVSLTAGAHPEPFLTLGRQQDQPMANDPSRIPRRMPTPYSCYPAGLQILSSDAENGS